MTKKTCKSELNGIKIKTKNPHETPLNCAKKTSTEVEINISILCQVIDYNINPFKHFQLSLQQTIGVKNIYC